MKKDIQKYIPKALEAVEQYLLTDKKVQKEYDGYAASLGAAIRNSGLIPALCFYTDLSRTDGDARRWKLLMAIDYVLSEEAPSAAIASDKKALLDKVIKAQYGQQAFADANRSPTATHRGEEADENLTLQKWKKNILNASICLLYTSPSPRDATLSRMPSSA